MEHETDDQRYGDGQDQQQRGSERSIRPGTAAPPTALVATALVANLGEGSLRGEAQ